MSLFSIAIHGGAGTILPADMTTELEQAYMEGMQDALRAGYAVLEKGGSATDAVIAACRIMEDNVLFNAGRGSVFSKSGKNEMDASIMDGSNLQAGAIAGVRHIRNPIQLAAEVMWHSDHVLLSGEGAVDFALSRGVEMMPDEYFFSQFRYDQWKAIRDSDQYVLDHSDPHMEELMKDKKFGTVGAVACDQKGHLAAATSTGGMTNKQYNRIGDTPLIGAGTYANDETCAISCTGHGEIFIEAVAAYDVSCLMAYRGLSLQEAMEIVVKDKLVRMKGEGGMIGVDARGRTALVFNTAGMYRGSKSSDGSFYTAIYG